MRTFRSLPREHSTRSLMPSRDPSGFAIAILLPLRVFCTNYVSWTLGLHLHHLMHRHHSVVQATHDMVQSKPPITSATISMKASAGMLFGMALRRMPVNRKAKLG